MPQQLAVESRKARREFVQCQNCRQGKNVVKKLFTCTGCNVATYCSRTCQKAHWPAHKSKCNFNQAQNSLLEALDEQVLSQSSASSDSSSRQPLPSQLKEELHAFCAKFNPALFQAGYNAVDIVEHSMAWQQIVLGVFLERISDCSPTSRLWSRFRVTSAEPIPVLALQLMFGVEEMEPFLRQKEQQERRDQENGHLGTISILMICSCDHVSPPLVLHNAAWVAFGAHSRAALDIADNWRETLITTVDRLCGRIPVESTSQNKAATTQSS